MKPRTVYICYRFRAGVPVYCGVEHRSPGAAYRCLRDRGSEPYNEWQFVTEEAGFYKRAALRGASEPLGVPPMDGEANG